MSCVAQAQGRKVFLDCNKHAFHGCVYIFKGLFMYILTGSIHWPAVAYVTARLDPEYRV